MSQSAVLKNNWILSRRVDLLWILGPSFWAVLTCVLFANLFLAQEELPLWYWVAFVLACDVAHVHSTLYRTYFVPQERKKYGAVLIYTPLFCFLCGLFLYSIHPGLFWRVLAYVAVFHFIRQQYGFLQIYSKNQVRSVLKTHIDTLMIYTAMLYPIVYWHTTERHFHWFVDGDFLKLPWPQVKTVGAFCYCAVIVVYAVSEVAHFFKIKQFNVQKNLIVLGTALVWYVGIVYYNNDTIFTITNVVAHGIPYMALVWCYGRKQNYSFHIKEFPYKKLFQVAGLPLFVGGLLLLAYVEEALWAQWVWREKLELFAAFQPLQILYSPGLLKWIVPMLMVPQFTHYILDGFIWKGSSLTRPKT